METKDYYNAVLKLQENKTLNTISVRDIASELGITTGALYYRFTNKSSLLNEMFKYYKFEMITHMESEKLSPTESLEKYVRLNIKNRMQFKYVFSSELNEFLTDDSIAYAVETHERLMKVFEIDYEEKPHIVTIVMGTLRAYLLTPKYFLDIDEEKLLTELVNIINRSHLFRGTMSKD